MTEYWFVDPESDGIRIYRRPAVSPSRAGTRFGRRVDLSADAGDVLTSPLFPGLEIPLSQIFADD